MTGEIHAAASVFTKRKEPSALVKTVAVWAAEPAWLLWGGKKIILPLPGIKFRRSVFPTAKSDISGAIPLFRHCLFRTSEPSYSFITPTGANLAYKYMVFYCCYMFRRHVRHIPGVLH